LKIHFDIINARVFQVIYFLQIFFTITL
jgi:hypothetical protein